MNDCIKIGEFKHYKQRPGTDIKELPPFPLEDMLDYPDARFRLMAIGIYLKAVVDYSQHMEEYAKNREYLRKYGHKPEDFSIKEGRMDEILTVSEVAKYLKISKAKIYYLIQRKEIPHIKIDLNVRIKQSDLEKWLSQKVVYMGDVWYTPGWHK